MRILTEQRRVQGLPVIECTNADAAGKLPVVVLLHGYTGRKEDTLLAAQRLAQAGYLAVCADLHLHGELGATPFDPAQVSPRFLEVISQSAANLATLAAAYPNHPRADGERIALVGISLGGAVIYHYLPRRAPAIKAAVCMIAGPTPLAETTFRAVQRLYPHFGVTDELLAALRAAGHALPFLEHITDFPLLMLYGQADPLIPIAGVRELYAGLKQTYTRPDRLELIAYAGVGHETPPDMFAQAARWLGQHL